MIFSSCFALPRVGVTHSLTFLTRTGNSTFAGATAAIMANVVLIGYVFVAMREDQSDQAQEKEGKKDR